MTDLKKDFEKFLLDDFVAFPKGKEPGQTNRWLFCHDFEGEDIADDCACCFGDPGLTSPCNCVCHFRISQLLAFMEKREKALLDRAERLVDLHVNGEVTRSQLKVDLRCLKYEPPVEHDV